LTTSYDLKSVQLPRLAGPALALFVSLVENPLTRGLLLPQLLKNGGIRALRAMLIDEPPTFQPPVPPASQPQTTLGLSHAALEALASERFGAPAPPAAPGFAFAPPAITPPPTAPAQPTRWQWPNAPWQPSPTASRTA
jgi:hypothetical protein